MKRRIYYFTGTGNSMRAARVIAASIGDTEIVSMRTDPADYPATDCDMVGFVYPVYHWTMPAHAVEFVKNLDINSNAYVFVIAMPSFICGAACERLAGILSKKGIRIHYGNLVYSVANYAIVYPPVPPAAIRVPKTEMKLKKIAKEILERKERAYPKASRFIKWRKKSFMEPYLKLQKYADHAFIVSEDCISCGICSKVCPCRNIRLENGIPVYQHHCANCMACVVCCPKRAIGYDIMSGDRELLHAMTKKTWLVKVMGLPKKRKLYRNPHIITDDLIKDREIWPKEAKQKKPS